MEKSVKNSEVISSDKMCGICQIVLTSKSSLRFHLKNVHENEEKAFKCNICNKAFKLLGNLKMHHQVVHGNIKQHKCDSFFFSSGTCENTYQYGS